MDWTGRGLLVISVPAFFVGGWVLFRSIAFVVKLSGSNDLGAWPVAPEQRITLKSAGPVELCYDGPRFSRVFAGLSIALTDAGTGAEVPGQPVLVPITSSSFSRVRMAVRSFEVPRAGDYVLRVTGLEPDRDYSQVRFAFRRPFGPQLVAGSLGIILAAFLTIGGLVFSALAWTGVLKRAGG